MLALRTVQMRLKHFIVLRKDSCSDSENYVIFPSVFVFHPLLSKEFKGKVKISKIVQKLSMLQYK